jgi:pseudomonalisin
MVPIRIGFGAPFSLSKGSVMRRAAVALVSAGLMLTCFLVVGSAAGAASGWVATATRAQTLVQATDLGREPGATPLHIVTALNLRNSAGLRQVVASGAVLTSAQFRSGYAPTAAQAQSVASYLTGQGFTHVTVAGDRLLVSADGNVARAASAFGTTIERFRQNGSVVHANITAARVPASLGGVVTAVLGLDNLHSVRTHSIVAEDPPVSCVIAGVGVPCTYSPKGFWKAYDVQGAPTGAATKVAIFTAGNLTGVPADLRTEEAAAGLPQVPLTVVNVGAAGTDTSGKDEWDMDTQFSTGMAGNVQGLYVYNATSLDDAALTESFNAFVTQDVAKAASASFGGCEFGASLDGSMAADDHVFLAAASQGQTVFASAGDTGGFCPVGAAVNGVPAGVPDVSYPASSPWVIGVGGTTLVTNADGSYDAEIAWLAGGGGPSLFEAQPAYQGGVAPPTGQRTVPDIAMDADPNTGANVYVGGQPEGVGGTSLSSPLALGVWARVASAHPIGFAGPAFYGASGGVGLHDIVLGDTGPYPATPGYDLATGVGTIDVSKFIAATR